MARRRKLKGSIDISSFIFFIIIFGGLAKCMSSDSKDTPRESTVTQTQSLISSVDISKSPMSSETISLNTVKENEVISIVEQSTTDNQKKTESKILKVTESTTKSPSSLKKREQTTTNRVKGKNKTNVQKSDASFQCGKKRLCSQMNNCAEAKFYLRQCGITRLDKDRDGIPCESLCG